jgi:hypothetical protein
MISQKKRERLNASARRLKVEKGGRSETQANALRVTQVMPAIICPTRVVSMLPLKEMSAFGSEPERWCIDPSKFARLRAPMRRELPLAAFV